MALRYGRIDSCIVFVQKGTATDEEWVEYVDFLKLHVPKMDMVRALIVADSGPTPRQRGMMDEVMKPYFKTARIAVLIRSTFARGVVHAIRLLIPAYRPFEPTEVQSAFDYLGVPASRHDPILAAANRWCAELRMPALGQ
jgi:hypothetical protein